MKRLGTVELVDANPFDYLAELQKHAKNVLTNPAHWMPWNYRQTIDRCCIGPAGV